MKAFLVITVILAMGLGFGVVQRSRLARLKVESEWLETSIAKRVSGESLPSKTVAHKTTRVSNPTAFAHMEAIIAISERAYAIAEKWRNPATRTLEVTAALKESLKNESAQMWPHYAALNHQQVMELIQKMQNDSMVPSRDKLNIAAASVERLSETNPAEALKLIANLEGLVERDRYLTQAFSRWVVENPSEAVRWFDEQSKMGNPVTRTSGVLQSMMLAEARHDPARAVSRILSDGVATTAESRTLLGARLASELRSAGEHQALLAAMRREGDKGSAPVLREVRSEYVANLASTMHGWPIEMATELMDAEFTSSEKLTASHLISPGGLAEPDHWATWFSQIKLAVDAKHPLVNFIGGWVQSDAGAAGKWLDQAPPGDLKNCAILQYASLAGAADPAHAARLLVTLPASPERAELLGRVMAHWKRQDPTAAAAFGESYQLTE